MYRAMCHCVISLPLMLLLVPVARGEERSGQVEFTSPVDLLAADGSLSAWGWARGNVMRYNREVIPASRQSRVKEWEHYTVMSPAFTAGITIAQLGPLTFGSVEVIDYPQSQRLEGMFFGRPSPGRSVFPVGARGDTELRSQENFVAFKVEGSRRLISWRVQAKPGGQTFTGELTLVDDPTTESIAIARPFAEPGQFFYENKIFGMPATGQARVDEREFALAEGESFAIFDWGRGVWPHESQWFWGQAAGMVGDERVAINLGHGYGDDARGTANAILVGSKLTKLDSVAVEYDAAERMKPWKFASDDGRLELVFEPLYHQQAKQAILIAASELHKIHGHFSGTLTVEGRKIEVRGMLGFAEHMSQRW